MVEDFILVMPSVSVIIPTFNNGRYLGQAVESVLAQTYTDYEIVVVDDGSTDDTLQSLQPYIDKMKYIYQDNQGVSVAQNIGAHHARGKYLVFSGADDCLLPNQLAVQIKAFEERPDIGLVACGYHYVDQSLQLIQESRPWIQCPTITLESVVLGGIAPPVAIMLRREWFEKVEGFDTELAYCEDSDLWTRLALAGCKMVWVPYIVSQYRIHNNNMSRSPEIHFSFHRRVLDKAFADPRMPDDLRRKRAWLDAQLDLAEAVRLLAGGWEGVARERIRRAITTEPDLMAQNGRGLAEIVVGQQSTVWGNGRFGEFVTEVMGAELPGLAHTLAVVAAQKRFYTAYSERRLAEVRRAWLDVARRDPRWLGNRGGWSMLRQSLVSDWSGLKKSNND